jgi:predicted nucleic acid-binding protein
MQGKPLTLQEGWKHVDALIASPGMGFFHEAPEVESTWRKLCQPFSASPKVVADAYLGALAIKGNLRFATMDSGFRQFSGLKLVDALLAPQS